MRLRLPLIAISMIVIAAGAFLRLTTVNRQGEQEDILRVGYFPNINHSQALLGIDDGSFQKAVGDELKIEWIQFTSGPAAMEAMFSGNLDISYIGSGPAINGYNRSKGDIVILSGVAEGGAVLLARKQDQINSIADLSGKMLAIPQYGNTQDIVLRKILKDAGLEDRSRGGDVDIIQAGGSDTMTLLERGDISAALVPEPWGAIIAQSESVEILLDEKELYRQGKYPTALIISRREALERYPEEIALFLKNHADLTDYMLENEEASIEKISDILVRLSGRQIPVEILAESFSRVNSSVRVSKDSIREMAELLRYVGYDRGSLDIEGIFRLDMLEDMNNKGREG